MKEEIVSKILKAYQIPDTDPIRNNLLRDIEDENLVSNLNSIHTLPRTMYNPFRVEMLIDDCIRLISSLLIKRTELKNLEVIMVRESAKKTMLNERIDNPAANNEYSAMMVGDIEKKIINDALSNKLAEYEKALDNLSNQIDSGLNYPNRYNELLEIYKLDYEEFYTKLKSVEVGVKTVYGIDEPLPTIDDGAITQALNKYYLWIKKILIKLDIILENEQEQTMIIPLLRGFEKTVEISGDNPVIEGKIKFVSDDQITAFKRTGKLQFNLTSELLPGKKFVRIRDVNVYIFIDKYVKIGQGTSFESLSSDHRNDIRNTTIKIPPQMDRNGNSWTAPELFFAAPLINSTIIESKNNCNSYYNANPFAGNWQIKVAKSSCSPDPQEYEREKIQDILLVLRVAFV